MGNLRDKEQLCQIARVLWPQPQAAAQDSDFRVKLVTFGSSFPHVWYKDPFVTAS